MFASLCILGRQPGLSLAELESLYGAEALQPVGRQAVLLDAQPSQVPFAFLGGTVKFCKVLTALDTTSWAEIQKFLESATPQHAAALPEGKLRLGLSVYGLSVNAKQLLATGLNLKKLIRSSGRPVRLVPNVEPALGSAQVLHNKLTSELGWELIFVRDNKRTIVAQTIAVQDIESYSFRDRERPKRDAKVGMLPPKLAQTIINLALPGMPDPVCGPNHPSGSTVLDPFCGTGVILQEAALMGHSVYGSDLEERMVEYSKLNMEWLSDRFKLGDIDCRIETGDATNHDWTTGFDTVASEVYLGRPFASAPSPQALAQTVQDTNTIAKKFLRNIVPQLKPGFRLCLALPAWHTNGRFQHLPLLDQIEELGYNRVRFVHASPEEMIYHRPGQVVGRELVVLTRT